MSSSGHAAIAKPHRPMPPNRTPSYKEGYIASNGTSVVQSTEWTRQHVLEGDGLLTLVFDHLWKSDRAKEHRLKTVCIPDTVVFEHNFPRAWYTHDYKAQEIVKRPGKFLDVHSIFAAFGEAIPGCEIVCQYYFKKPQAAPNAAPPTTTPSTGAAKRRRKLTSADDASSIAVEFFTADTLHAFLHSRSLKPDGILQRFVIPKGKPSHRSNFQVQAIWSPIVTLVYKRTTSKLLNDRSASLEERAATFDGPPHFSQESLVAASTQARIDALCRDIVKHFYITEHKPLARMVLYFKEDDQDKLWVLWASSIRVGGDRLNPVTMRVPLQLSLKVDAAEGEEHAGASMQRSSRRQVDLALLKRDAELYNMTGDIAFARKCGGVLPRSRSRSPEGPGADRMASAGAAVASVPATSSPQSGRPRPTQAVFVGGRPRLFTPPRLGHVALHDAGHDVAPPHISPRAPFFATTRQDHVVGLEDEAHPLHAKFATLSPRPPQDGGNAAARRWKSEPPSDATTRGSNALLRKTETAVCLSQLTDRQRQVRLELITAAADSLYESYCSLLSSSQTGTAVPRPQVLLHGMLRAVLDPCDFDGLLDVLRLQPLDKSDPSCDVFVLDDPTAIGRGMRKDRPSAQIYAEIEDYFTLVCSHSGDTLATRVEGYVQNVVDGHIDAVAARKAAAHAAPSSTAEEKQQAAQQAYEDAELDRLFSRSERRK